MKQNFSFAKKLSGYSAAASVILLFAKESSAQILYKDINPDFSSPEGLGHLALDLNNDGVVDFQIVFGDYITTSGSSSAYLYIGTINWISVKAMNGNQLIGQGGNFSSAAKLYTNDPISSAALWIGGSNYHVMGYFYDSVHGNISESGPWQNVTNGFLGLRLVLNNHEYYGWVRLDVINYADHAVVKDYALNILPDQPILAGEISIPTGGLAENTFADLHILQTENGIMIRTSSIQPFTISLVDLDGREIQRIEKQTSDQFISTMNLAEGIYFVRAESSKESLVKKIFVR
ncbi:MAG: T9SS type A sorting domain-containing protein [Chitinophagales bacterium]